MNIDGLKGLLDAKKEEYDGVVNQLDYLNQCATRLEEEIMRLNAQINKQEAKKND